MLRIFLGRAKAFAPPPAGLGTGGESLGVGLYPEKQPSPWRQTALEMFEIHNCHSPKSGFLALPLPSTKAGDGSSSLSVAFDGFYAPFFQFSEWSAAMIMFCLSFTGWDTPRTDLPPRKKSDRLLFFFWKMRRDTPHMGQPGASEGAPAVCRSGPGHRPHLRAPGPRQVRREGAVPRGGVLKCGAHPHADWFSQMLHCLSQGPCLVSKDEEQSFGVSLVTLKEQRGQGHFQGFWLAYGFALHTSR